MTTKKTETTTPTVEAIVEEFDTDYPCFECDGSGNIPQQVGEEEWTASQCQTCWQYRLPAIAKLKTAITSLTTAHEAELKEAYALAEIIRQRTANEILDLIIKHDPSSFRPTSKEYWGNTLYAEIEARYLPQPPLSDVKE